MAVDDVCRLCLSTDDLIWIFDVENKKLKMKDIVSITTGIEIHMKDIISQKICGKCYQFSINIFQFRGQCLKADKYLKSMCMDYLVEKKLYIPNTEVSIKSVVENKEAKQPKADKERPPIHPSIVRISRAYPEIKLPRSCLHCDVEPVVEMELDRVENYFKRQKIDVKYSVKNASQSKEPVSAPKSSKQKNTLTPTQAGSSKLVKSDDPKSQDQTVGPDFNTSNKNQIKKNKKSPSWASIKIKLKKSKTNMRKRKRGESIVSFGNPSTIKKKKLEICENPLKEMETCRSNQNSSRLCHYTDEELSQKNNGKIDSLQITGALLSQNEKLTGQEIIPNNENELLLTNAKSNANQLDENDDHDPLTRVGKSVPLFVCQICNAVHYNMHELKKHQVKHMRCQFCKVRCRSLEQKRFHIEKQCTFKKMMIDLPQVALTRIECNIMVREKYPNAFVGFPVLSHVELSNPQSISFKTLLKDFPPERLHVIEILSDDDILIEDNEDLTIVPDITSNVFTKLNTTRGDLKDILPIFQKDSKKLGTQTVLPNVEDIITKKKVVALKNLVPYLSMYHVPINFQKGDFSVSYDFNRKSKSFKSLSLWNDLTPIDVNVRTDSISKISNFPIPCEPTDNEIS